MKKLLFVFVLLLMALPPAYGNELKLRGSVLDDMSRKGIPGLTVKFMAPTAKGISHFTTFTSQNGQFQFSALGPGTYLLEVYQGVTLLYRREMTLDRDMELVIYLQRRIGDIDLTAKPPETFTNSIDMSFRLIPAGSFKMGSPDGEDGRFKDERQHLVTISKPFYLQTTEVTQKQWTQVMGSNPSFFKECGNDCPVETVSWEDAQEFIRNLNQREGGKKYRLPTEAEWEYACRAKSEGRFCFGNQKAELEKYAWYATNPFSLKTHPVSKREPNAWGLYDMHGNVKEWCQDWHGDYPSSQVTDPTGPKAGKERVSRGGSYSGDSRRLRSANRGRERPDHRGSTVGFRVAKDL